jgi:hypothetical protein
VSRSQGLAVVPKASSTPRITRRGWEAAIVWHCNAEHTLSPKHNLTLRFCGSGLKFAGHDLSHRSRGGASQSGIWFGAFIWCLELLSVVVPPDDGRAEASCAAEHASAQRVSAQRAAAECTAQRAASPSSATDEINYQGLAVVPMLVSVSDGEDCSPFFLSVCKDNVRDADGAVAVQYLKGVSNIGLNGAEDYTADTMFQRAAQRAAQRAVHVLCDALASHE